MEFLVINFYGDRSLSEAVARKVGIKESVLNLD